MPFDAEEEILETFGDLITRADDKARMEHWLYANDTNAALRAAIRLGGNEPAIVKARAAVNEKVSNAKALIEGLPSSVHQDAGVLFSRIQLSPVISRTSSSRGPRAMAAGSSVSSSLRRLRDGGVGGSFGQRHGALGHSSDARHALPGVVTI
jgi:hypothetical protein